MNIMWPQQNKAQPAEQPAMCTGDLTSNFVWLLLYNKNTALLRDTVTQISRGTSADVVHRQGYRADRIA